MADDCILWTGAVWPHGYGAAWDAERKRTTTAHRRAYEQAYGPIPPGHDVHHVCETKLCINPEHLVALTRARHMRGDRRSRLTAEQVADMRRLRDERGLSYRALGRLFGIPHQHAWAICTGRKWREEA